MFLIFAPKSEECAVHLTWELLENGETLPDPNVIIDGEYLSATELLRSKGCIYETGERQLLFGHALSDGTAIESKFGRHLTAEWWNFDRKFKLAAFHVCHGAKFFSNPYFQDIYDDWISYQQEVMIIFGSKKTTAIWLHMFKDMFKALQHSNEGVELKEKFIDIYEKKMQELDAKPIGSLSQLAITYLEWSIDSLRSKAEINQH